MITHKRQERSQSAVDANPLCGLGNVAADHRHRYDKISLISVVIAMTTLMTTPVVRSSAAPNSTSDLQTIALESQAAPAELGGVYSKIHSSTVSDSGDVAFSASLSGSAVISSILLKSGNDTRVIFRAGDGAPRGGTYKGFNELDLTQLRTEQGDYDVLFFRAELEGSSATEGIFLWTPEGVDEIARAGDRSPRGHIYKSFNCLTIEGRRSPALSWRSLP